MLSYSELRPGITFVLDGEPYVVIEYNFLRMQQRKPVAQTRIRNLRTGKIAERTFHQNDSFHEANIEKRDVMFIYARNDEYFFHEKGNPSKRFTLKEEVVGEVSNFIKQGTEVKAWDFKDTIINIEIPIKMDLVVKEAAPAIKGNTVQGGSKEVILETGYKIQVPMFINEGDILRINTTSGEYVERVEKK